MALLVHVVVAGRLHAGAVGLFLADLALEQLGNAVHALVQVGLVLGLAGDDQRRTRFIDQDRVHFVDDRVVQRALHALRRVVDHVVAQVVEAELVVRAVGDVRVIGALLLVMRHLREVDPHRQPQEVVQAAHPLGIALGQIVVHGHHVHALAGNGIEVHGQRGGQRLALAGTHFGDLVVVQDHAADQLHVEVAHLHDALAGLAAYGKSLWQQRFERLAAGVALPEGLGHAAQVVVRELLELRLQRIDLRHRAAILFDQPLIAAAEDFLEKARDHRLLSPARNRVDAPGKRAAPAAGRGMDRLARNAEFIMCRGHGRNARQALPCKAANAKHRPTRTDPGPLLASVWGRSGSFNPHPPRQPRRPLLECSHAPLHPPRPADCCRQAAQ
ncbi:hypothetical protein D3C81_780090 [compost metagenome]